MVSRRVRRRRRQFATVGVVLLAILVYLAFFSGGGPKTTPPPKHRDASSHKSFPAHSPLNPDWKGNGKAVTLAFGGDVHFEGAVGVRLTAPSCRGGDRSWRRRGRRRGSQAYLGPRAPGGAR